MSKLQVLLNTQIVSILANRSVMSYK